MLLVLLACGPSPKDTAAPVDTGADADADTDTVALLDACVVSGIALTEDWSAALPGVGGTPVRLLWEDGALAVFEASGAAADTLRVFDLPAPAAAASDLAARWSMTADASFVGLAFPTDTVAVGDGATLRVFDRATGTTLATATADASITALAADGAGVLGGTTGTPFLWGSAGLRHDAVYGASDAGAVGRTTEGYWSATDPVNPAVSFSDGGARTDTTVPAFGAAVDVVRRPAGGAWVLGGPESYAWIAAFDGAGALVTYTQTYVGITQAVGAPASAYAWSGFREGGIVAFDDAGFTNLYSARSADMTAVAIDPDGRWVLTAHPDGMLRRWSCVP